MSSTRSRFSGRSARGRAAVLACLLGGACQPTPLARENTGTVRMALEVAPGVTLTSASYAIDGPGDLRRTGEVAVGDSPNVSVNVGPVPVGGGYRIEVIGVASDDTTVCGGKAMFNVPGGAQVMVVVHLTCHANATGAVAVTGSFNLCPSLEGLTATPLQVLIGGTVSLSADVHDADNGPQPLRYKWLATSGSFDDPQRPEPVFTCTTAGMARVGLVVSDGDPDPDCADKRSVEIECTSPAP